MDFNKKLEKAVQFLKKSFKENPHYSFGDWTIMANHSIEVMKYSIQLSKEKSVDELVIAIASLFHDIGKSYLAEEQILLEKHEELGWEVSKDFLKTLNITERQLEQIRSIFEGEESLERQIVKDADYISFYKDKRLHNAFKKWAEENDLPQQIQRKLQQFNKMSEEAKKIAEPFFLQLKKEWGN